MAAPARAIRPPVKSLLLVIPPGRAIPPVSSRSSGWWMPPRRIDGRTGGVRGPHFESAALFTSQPSFVHDLATVSRLKEKNPGSRWAWWGPRCILAQESLTAGPRGGFCGPPGVRLHCPRFWPRGGPGARFRAQLLPADGRIDHNPDRPFLEDLGTSPAHGHGDLPPGSDHGAL